jgi:hypothetical protein
MKNMVALGTVFKTKEPRFHVITYCKQTTCMELHRVATVAIRHYGGKYRFI